VEYGEGAHGGEIAGSFEREATEPFVRPRAVQGKARFHRRFEVSVSASFISFVVVQVARSAVERPHLEHFPARKTA
jgi:hypothetical protein